MTSLEQYILNTQIDQILEDINNESINEGKVKNAFKKFWKWLFGGSSNKDKENFSYNGSHIGTIPSNLNDDEISDKLKSKSFNYIDFVKLDKKTYSTNPISFIKSLIANNPNQFNYVETLLHDKYSILYKFLGDNNFINLGLLYCEDPFNGDEKNILFTGICLYIYRSDINKNALEKIQKYAGTDSYDNYGFIICLDIMKSCISNNDFSLYNKLYNGILKKIKDNHNSTSYSGISTIINTSNDYGTFIKKFFIDKLKFEIESNDNNKQYDDTDFLYKSNI